MKKNTVKIMALAGILCLASVGGVSAYLTDYEKVSNEFTVGKVDIELKEPEWKPEENRISNRMWIHGRISGTNRRYTLPRSFIY